MIVAYGNNWEIGLNNKMLWHISEDFKNFKKITSGHHILMGRKTFESIGKPLPNRTSLVLSKEGFSHEGVHTFKEIDTAVSFAKDAGEDELFVIGGAKIYELLFPYIDTMYLSAVDFEGDADAYLKPIDFTSWELKQEQHYEAIRESGAIKSPSWIFRVYEKRQP